MSQIVEKLKSMGIDLPDPVAPVANYVPYVLTGNILTISGQLPLMPDGAMVKGCLGNRMSAEDGANAAKLCAVQILAQANKALGGDLEKIKRCVKLGGFVCATPDFTDHPKVINGASNLMVEALGDAGRHARFAVGVASLPFGVAVEIDAVFEVDV